MSQQCQLRIDQAASRRTREEVALEHAGLFERSLHAAPLFSKGLSTTLEGFFNVVDMYRDKRIFFSSPTYEMRVQLSICYYNENKDREVTSIWERKRSSDGRVMDKRRHFVDPSFDFASAIWLRFLCSDF